jgi:hypothetical protein
LPGEPGSGIDRLRRFLAELLGKAFCQMIEDCLGILEPAVVAELEPVDGVSEKQCR